jgi:hypothetical protein
MLAPFEMRNSINKDCSLLAAIKMGAMNDDEKFQKTISDLTKK